MQQGKQVRLNDYVGSAVWGCRVAGDRDIITGDVVEMENIRGETVEVRLGAETGGFDPDGSHRFFRFEIV